MSKEKEWGGGGQQKLDNLKMDNECTSAAAALML